ncbi:hypothetical protein D3C87_1564920 [compost metagenome]
MQGFIIENKKPVFPGNSIFCVDGFYRNPVVVCEDGLLAGFQYFLFTALACNTYATFKQSGCVIAFIGITADIKMRTQNFHLLLHSDHHKRNPAQRSCLSGLLQFCHFKIALAT